MRRVFTEQCQRLATKVVIKARDLAEAGAGVAIEAPVARHHEHWEDLTSDSCVLLGCVNGRDYHRDDDIGLGSECNCTPQIVHECSYEHRRGMVFTRFLGKHRLSIDREMRPPVSLNECEELANDHCVDRSALASRVARQVLWKVFHVDHPEFEGPLAREHIPKLEYRGEGLLREVFTATDSLRRASEPRQTTKQVRINRSEVKAGVDEAFAATQFFSGTYIAQFLLAKSLGAAVEAQSQIGTITARRSLLHLPDPVPDLANALSDGLQVALAQAEKHYSGTYEAELKRLSAVENWQTINKLDRNRILKDLHIACATKGVTGSVEDVLESVQRIPLDAWRSRAAALPQLFANARKQADKLVEPKTPHVKLRSSTLRIPDEVNAWVARTEQELLKQNPIMVS